MSLFDYNDAIKCGQFVEANRAWHNWDPNKVVKVIGVFMRSFSQEFVSAVFSDCGLKQLDGYTAVAKLFVNQELTQEGSVYSIPRRLASELREELGKTVANPEPEYQAVSETLESLVTQVPEGTQRDFIQEAVTCCRAKAYRSAVVMSWNFTIDNLISWVIGDPGKLNLFNSAWTSEWANRKEQIKNSELTGEEVQGLRESVVLRICKSSGLINKDEEALLSEGLRMRNQAAHPSVVITFDPPVVAGHISKMIRFAMTRMNETEDK